MYTSAYDHETRRIRPLLNALRSAPVLDINPGPDERCLRRTFTLIADFLESAADSDLHGEQWETWCVLVEHVERSFK
jgi:hypothetical protein